MDVKFIDPYEAVLIETGYGLDAIGALKDVGLLRDGVETDHDYRMRPIARLREEPEPSPNHVRDAVRANP